MTIAVCVSGISSRVPEYKKVIELQKKVFPYEFFFQQWKGYPKPDFENCLFTQEPTWDYHVITEAKVKPECKIYERYIGPRGKIKRKGLGSQFRYSANQIISHAQLVDSLPAEYTHIIKCRFDTLVSTKVNFQKYIDMLLDGWNIGFYTSGKNNPTPEHTLIEYDHTGPRCKWRLFDHLLFHPRERLKNVFEMKEKKELLGAEWGWYQLLVHQWGDLKYKNISGGESLVKCTQHPLQWDSF
jgi:hypothetical protein